MQKQFRGKIEAFNNYSPWLSCWFILETLSTSKEHFALQALQRSDVFWPNDVYQENQRNSEFFKSNQRIDVYQGKSTFFHTLTSTELRFSKKFISQSIFLIFECRSSLSIVFMIWRHWFSYKYGQK